MGYAAQDCAGRHASGSGKDVATAEIVFRGTIPLS